MRDTWYGDRADLVKWGTLIHLAQREKLGRVVQIAFLRRGEASAPYLPWSRRSAESGLGPF